MKRKVVTLCGSLKYINEMQEIAERLSLKLQYVVIGINPHVIDRTLTEAEKQLLSELHLEKIAISDAIFVVNIGGYLGNAVKREIEYAKTLGKEIMYLENSDKAPVRRGEGLNYDTSTENECSA